ncbi:MAG: 2-oxoglutarate dehydrogenase, E2 component, dihydrolipoamide succinyltransferase [Bacteroidota bacterium]|nr:2-oxoglutarate dehydrogenase, E2 component, dihydrolipoamide succinyltransferase [Candidatus Kapabacteria bacterium]MDW8074622.1 2-oxoglutarate dehydrogenase, E2 component, dihydrolipoamide succinyltransferase [Bacteroidota bacterium]
MKVDVVMPKMGESVQEGKILRWVKKVGDRIERDEVLLEISTDKVDTEVPAPASGVITELLANEGDTVEVGKVIARIETEATAASAPQPSAAPQEPAHAPQSAGVQSSPSVVQPTTSTATVQPAPAASNGGQLVEVVMPKMGESVQEGKILRWVKNVGERVERDEVLLEISTDKVDTEVPSPASGILVERLANEGDVVEVGRVIARIAVGSGATVSPPATTPVQQASESTSASQQAVSQPARTQTTNGVQGATAPPPMTSTRTMKIPRVHGQRFYSPLVRTIAEAEGVSLEELETIQGTGLGGRVTKHDLLRYIEQRKSQPAFTPQPAIAPSAEPVVTPTVTPTPTPVVPTPTPAAPVSAPTVITPPSPPPPHVPKPSWGPDVEIIPMDRVRQLIAEHMVRSKHTSPHVTSVAEADVTGIIRAHQLYREEFQRREGIKLTLTPFFAKAIIEGVKQYPMVNVSVDGTNIVVHKNINLSFATLLPDGNLIVPVIKKAQHLNITGLAHAITDLATRARNKKLNPDEIQGGTISLTNMGPWGSLFGTPVINQPQTAIVGVYAVQKRPVVKEINGEDVIMIRHMMYVTITYDHRVIDGALGSSCLRAIVQALEAMNPETVQL